MEETFRQPVLHRRFHMHRFSQLWIKNIKRSASKWNVYRLFLALFSTIKYHNYLCNIHYIMDHKSSRDDSKYMGGCVLVICKCYSILFKGSEDPGILVSKGFNTFTGRKKKKTFTENTISEKVEQMGCQNQKRWLKSIIPALWEAEAG